MFVYTAFASFDEQKTIKENQKEKGDREVCPLKHLGPSGYALLYLLKDGESILFLLFFFSFSVVQKNSVEKPCWKLFLHFVL